MKATFPVTAKGITENFWGIREPYAILNGSRSILWGSLLWGCIKLHLSPTVLQARTRTLPWLSSLVPCSLIRSAPEEEHTDQNPIFPLPLWRYSNLTSVCAHAIFRTFLGLQKQQHFHEWGHTASSEVFQVELLAHFKHRGYKKKRSRKQGIMNVVKEITVPTGEGKQREGRERGICPKAKFWPS